MMKRKEHLSIIAIKVMVKGKGGDGRTEKSSVHNEE